MSLLQDVCGGQEDGQLLSIRLKQPALGVVILLGWVKLLIPAVREDVPL